MVVVVEELRFRDSLQISWQVQHSWTLDAQISWKAQHLAILDVQTSWQAQHLALFGNLKVHIS